VIVELAHALFGLRSLSDTKPHVNEVVAGELHVTLLHPVAGLAQVVLVVADFKGIRDG